MEPLRKPLIVAKPVSPPIAPSIICSPAAPRKISPPQFGTAPVVSNDLKIEAIVVLAAFVVVAPVAGLFRLFSGSGNGQSALDTTPIPVSSMVNMRLVSVDSGGTFKYTLTNPDEGKVAFGGDRFGYIVRDEHGNFWHSLFPTGRDFDIDPLETIWNQFYVDIPATSNVLALEIGGYPPDPQQYIILRRAGSGFELVGQHAVPGNSANEFLNRTLGLQLGAAAKK